MNERIRMVIGLNKTLGCIIVTYNPDEERFEKVLDRISKQCDKLLIIDNNSMNSGYVKRICEDNGRIKLVQLERNYGIARALNIGIGLLKQDPVDWILTLDQDTLILCNIHDILDKINIIDAGIVWLASSETNSKDLFFINKDPIIISGSIINFEVISYGVKFREEFFLDHVDTDLDYQVRKLGFKVLRTSKRCIDHEWGKEMFIGSKKTRAATNLRVYLTIRNGTRLFLEKKLSFRIYMYDNLYYIRHNIYKLRNILSISLIIIGAVTDGSFNKFVFLKKFKRLLQS